MASSSTCGSSFSGAGRRDKVKSPTSWQSETGHLDTSCVFHQEEQRGDTLTASTILISDNVTKVLNEAKMALHTLSTGCVAWIFL